MTRHLRYLQEAHKVAFNLLAKERNTKCTNVVSNLSSFKQARHLSVSANSFWRTNKERSLSVESKPLFTSTSTPIVSCSQRSFHNIFNHVDFETYEKACSEYALEIPEYYNFARDVIDEWALREQNGLRSLSNPALWWIDDAGNERKYSFQQISELSKRMANVLTGPCQLKRGDRIMVFLPRYPEWWVIIVAAIRAGIVVIPGTMLLTAKDIHYRLGPSCAKCIITSEEKVASVDEAVDKFGEPITKLVVGNHANTRPGWLNYDDLMSKSGAEFQANIRLFSSNSWKAEDGLTQRSKWRAARITFLAVPHPSLAKLHPRFARRSLNILDYQFPENYSGTTGLPKMTEHSHGSYGLGHITTARYFLRINSDDVVWNLSDTGWAKASYSSLFGPWMVGACVFQQHYTVWNPLDNLKVLDKYPITTFCCPPTASRLYVSHDLTKFTFKHLRTSICAGEPMNPELYDIWLAGTGLTLFEGYGQTETAILCSTYPNMEIRRGSMGKAIPGIDLKIVDEDGTVLPPGTEGDIAICIKPERPLGLFKQYVDEPKRTLQRFIGDFYLTGDRGMMDDDNYVWFVGRSDDIIISSGYRIGPFEVESALIEHPSVMESACVSSPDEVRGEVVKAFVILHDGYKNHDQATLIKELQNFVKRTTAPYKYPRKIEFVDDLPKTISGKIRRVELRQKEAEKNS